MINTNHITIITTYYAFGEEVKLLPHYFIFYCGHFFCLFLSQVSLFRLESRRVYLAVGLDDYDVSHLLNR